MAYIGLVRPLASVATSVAESASEVYEYDSSTGVVNKITSNIAGLDQVDTFTYDAVGNVKTKTTVYNGKQRVETYTYDNDGNITNMTAVNTSV